jgi:hypothetical protein
VSLVPSSWMMSLSIEEGRAASKSPHLKSGYFLSMSSQADSADIIQIQLLDGHIVQGRNGIDIYNEWRYTWLLPLTVM